MNGIDSLGARHETVRKAYTTGKKGEERAVSSIRQKAEYNEGIYGRKRENIDIAKRKTKDRTDRIRLCRLRCTDKYKKREGREEIEAEECPVVPRVFVDEKFRRGEAAVCFVTHTKTRPTREIE